MAFYLLDLETTGLGLEGRAKDYVLELGVAVYDDELEFQDSHSWFVGDYPTYRRFLQVDEELSVVHDMHRKSGLYEEWMSAYQLSTLWPAHKAGLKAVDWFKKRGLAPGEEPMVGSSINFDRERFLKYEMPELNDLFHYRVIDASSQRAFKQKRHPRFAAEAAKIAADAQRNSHRVLDDIHDSVNLLRVLDGLEPRY